MKQKRHRKDHLFAVPCHTNLCNKGDCPLVILLRLEREVSDRRDAGGLIHTRNAEDDVLAALAVESHEAHNIAAIRVAVADADRHVATMLGNDVIEQRNRAGMQSQRIFNRLRKLDHVPSHDIVHSAGKPSHVVVIVALDACRELL